MKKYQKMVDKVPITAQYSRDIVGRVVVMDTCPLLLRRRAIVAYRSFSTKTSSKQSSEFS